MSVLNNILEYVLLLQLVMHIVTGTYVVSDTRKSFANSLSNCRDDDMDLATIESEMKRRYIRSLLREKGVSEDIWIDLQLSIVTLANGSLLYEDSYGIITSYLPWDTKFGEPDKQSSDKCVRLAETGYFRTSPCSKWFKYVCVESQEVPSDRTVISGDTTTLIESTERLTTDRSNKVSESEALSTTVSEHETTSTFITQTTVHVNNEHTETSSGASSDPTIYVTEDTISTTNYIVHRTEQGTIRSETTSLLSTLSGNNSQNPVPEGTFTSFVEGSANQGEREETTDAISVTKTVNIPDSKTTTQTSLPYNFTIPSGNSTITWRSMTTYSDTVSRSMEKDYTVFTCCSAGCNFERFNWSDPEFLRWLSKRLSEIRDSLIIDKKNTTTFKNSKRSPIDKRTSSVITGSFGAVIIFILVAAITIPDLLMLMTFLKDKFRATKEITSDMQTQKGSNVP